MLRALGLHADPVRPRPRVAARRLAISGRKAARRGAWQITVTSTLTSTRSLGGDQVHHRSQQHQARDSCVARVGVREEPAEVAQRQRAEQRLADRVREHVGVGMAAQPARGGHRHAAQHQRPPVDQRMQVEAEPGRVSVSPGPPPEPGRAVSRSSGVVILRFWRGPGTIATGRAQPLHEHRVVGPREAVPPRLVVRLPRESRAKGLRGLGEPEAVAVERGLAPGRPAPA